jgi:hypothetical protein
MTNRKNTIVRLLTLALIVLFTLSISVLAKDVSVVLDGSVLEFDVKPTIIDGRTMVPMRKIFESLGAEVEWEGSTKTITAKKKDTTVVMQIDNNVLSVNGKAIELDVPPQLVDGRTLVPVRAIAESFEIKVIWDDVTRSVLLTTFIPFESPIDAFNYLCDWLLENGETVANHTEIGWMINDDNKVKICCYPEGSNGTSTIAFYLTTFTPDDVISTAVFLHPTRDGKEIYATYDSLGETFRIDGDINMAKHTSNYPLSYRECTKGIYPSEYSLVEETRQRINLLLDETAILLHANNTKVTLTTLGFIKH